MIGLSRTVAALLLAAIAIHRYLVVHPAPGIDRYQGRIREVAMNVPHQMGAWVGQDVPVSVQAMSVLRPNVMISRRYTNVENGTSAGLLLVHCSNMHHIAGHFPLRCYPAQGWDLRGSRSRDWTVSGLRITGTEYEFFKQEEGPVGGEQSIIVENCLLRPGGRIFRDMDGLTDAVDGAAAASFGAGEVQFYFDASVSQDQRDGAVEVILAGYRPVIDAILEDAPSERVARQKAKQ